MDAKVKGLEALIAKWAKVPASVQAATHNANDQNALEFMSRVHAIIPREAGKLADTLVKEPGKTPTAVKVAIGGPGAPYPAHLEFGHRDGSGHVPAKPFWFTTLRVNRKRFRGRGARAASTAIRALPKVTGE
jgi:hypothetical protein